MKRYLVLILAILVLTSGALAACGQKSEAPASPTPEQTEPKPQSPSSEDWEILNRWLGDLYGLPPVSNTEQLQSAAWLVRGFWFGKVDEEIKRLEEYDIPWSRTAPFFYLWNYYLLHNIQLRNASTPLEFMAADSVLADSVIALHEAADELVQMKQLGETLRIFPTDEDAMKWFKELDKDWERLMEEAIEKGK
jgi:predicted small lipoprotein YifL